MGWAPKGYRRKIGKKDRKPSRLRPKATARGVAAKLKDRYKLSDGRLVLGCFKSRLLKCFRINTALPFLPPYEQMPGIRLRAKCRHTAIVIIGEVL